jgi:acyl-coenzyme A synthetase/AMP-(fatty) acid ligase
MATLRGRLSEHKQIAEVEFVEAIPKSAAGKILRKDLRAKDAAARAAKAHHHHHHK